uniref:Uncharacterized protein n=1 Tax=Anguilla anguilla TaxID=7936 RepID=A0A0E9SUP5_ANGAN
MIYILDHIVHLDSHSVIGPFLLAFSSNYISTNS